MTWSTKFVFLPVSNMQEYEVQYFLELHVQHRRLDRSIMNMNVVPLSRPSPIPGRVPATLPYTMPIITCTKPCHYCTTSGLFSVSTEV